MYLVGRHPHLDRHGGGVLVLLRAQGFGAASRRVGDPQGRVAAGPLPPRRRRLPGLSRRLRSDPPPALLTLRRRAGEVVDVTANVAQIAALRRRGRLAGGHLLESGWHFTASPRVGIRDVSFVWAPDVVLVVEDLRVFFRVARVRAGCNAFDVVGLHAPVRFAGHVGQRAARGLVGIRRAALGICEVEQPVGRQAFARGGRALGVDAAFHGFSQRAPGPASRAPAHALRDTGWHLEAAGIALAGNGGTRRPCGTAVLRGFGWMCEPPGAEVAAGRSGDLSQFGLAERRAAGQLLDFLEILGDTGPYRIHFDVFRIRRPARAAAAAAAPSSTAARGALLGILGVESGRGLDLRDAGPRRRRFHGWCGGR